MNYENHFQQAITECLEKAIVSVALDEFDRLSKGVPPIYRGARVYTAFDELGKLLTDKMPDYNHEWLPLLYLTWYHPSQVNLAYSIIMKHLKHGLTTESTSNRKLYVFDFGCGNLAMLFGVAIAELRCRMNGHQTVQIRVDSMDSSKPMTDLGEKVWKRFNKCVQGEHRLPNLAAIDSRIINEVPSEFHQDADGRWLSALHAIYPANNYKVERGLDKIARSINPTVGVITSFVGKKNWAEGVSPFNSLSTEMRKYTDFEFWGNLATITNCRKGLRDRLLLDASLKQTKTIEEFMDKVIPSYKLKYRTQNTIRYLLNGNVTWEVGATPYVAIY